MNHLKRNIKSACLVLIILLLLQMGYFYYNLFLYSDRWFSDPNNTRIRIDMIDPDIIPGRIMDRNHRILVETKSVTGRNGITTYYRDYHSYSKFAAHIVGTKRYGIGAEAFYIRYLLGYDNNLIERIYQKAFMDQEVGNNVILTIDVELQKFISEAMGTKKGSVVVMNPETGEILAMVSKPSFDPAKEGEKPADESLLNKASYGRYPPGSTMKLVTAAAALEFMEDIDNYIVECNGETVINGVKVTCYGGEAHGKVDLSQAMVYSCNAFFAQVSCEMGWKKLKKTGENFGFNKDFLFSDIRTTSSQLPIERWTDDEELAWSGVGQGNALVSPLHMAMIASAVANNGVMMEPKLIHGIETRSGRIRFHESSVFKQPISAQTANKLTNIMIDAVKKGTGKKADITDVQIAGKTGTAEVGENKKPHAWFIGFAPAEKPTLVVTVVLENTGTGGSNAAPLAGKIVQKAFGMGY